MYLTDYAPSGFMKRITILYFLLANARASKRTTFLSITVVFSKVPAKFYANSLNFIVQENIHRKVLLNRICLNEHN